MINDKQWLIDGLMKDVEDLKQRLEKIQTISSIVIFGLLLVIAELVLGLYDAI